MALIFRRKKIWAEIETEMRERRDAELDHNTFFVSRKHPHTDFRKSKTSNGVFQLRKQCMQCGELVGSAYRRDAVADFDGVPLVEEDLKQGKQSEIRDRHAAHVKYEEERQRAFWDYYNAHLNSQEWRDKCRLKRERANNICEGCGVNKVNHIHHLTYKNLGDEFLFELMALCVTCHQKLHPHREIA